MNVNITNTSAVNIKYKINDILVDDQSLSKNYECPICCDLILDIEKREALQCKEGHTVCFDCWTRSLIQKKECLICRTSVPTIQSLCRNRFIENEFNDKSVYCPFSVKKIYSLNNFKLGGGSSSSTDNLLCKEIITIDKLNQHIKECNYQLLKCECGKIIQKNKLAQHDSEECTHSNQQCKYCKKNNILRNALDLHYLKCSKFLIQCRECKNQVERGDLHEHNKNTCPSVIVGCKYRNGGCDAKMKRSALSTHLLSDHSYYIDKIIENQDSKILEVNKKYELLQTKLIQLEARMESHSEFLIEQLNSRNKKELKYENKWVISNYPFVASEYQHREFIQSRYIPIGEYGFYLKLFPYGLAGKPGKLSMIVVCESDEPIEVMFSLHIENSGFLNDDIERSEKFIFNYHDSFKLPVLCDSRDIVNPFMGYLSEDDLALTINFEIEILGFPLVDE